MSEESGAPIERETPIEEETEQPVAAAPKKPNRLEEAEKAAKRLEAANKKQEELLDRAEDLRAREIISGTGEAGQKPEKKEETPEEYAQRISEGKLKDGEG